MPNKAIFFDRDGVINRDYGYVGKIENFEFLPEVQETLGRLKALGYKLILITNQSGIARGRYTEADFWQVTNYMQQQLAPYQASFDAVYFCPHHPEAQVLEYRRQCSCRKPQPGLFLQALAEHELQAEHCLAVGDQPRDLIAASRAGITRLYLNSSTDNPELKDLYHQLLPKLSLLPELLQAVA
ncbi:MAG: HAD family hydrolase [Succinivibrio sp.]|nr:HAD family hydrolase [Succinivibrio sp.]